MLEITSRYIRLPKSIMFIPGLSLCAVTLLAGACKSDYQGAARQNSPGNSNVTRQVKTARVEETPFGESVTANGTLAAYDQTTASVKVPGRLQTITVDLGSVVRRGQVIAQVEPQDYNLRIQQAEAALAQARARVGLSADGKDDRIDPEKTGTVRQAQALLDDAKLKF